MKVGNIDVVPLSDGTAMMPKEFWVGFDFDRHPDVLARRRPHPHAHRLLPGPHR